MNELTSSLEEEAKEAKGYVDQLQGHILASSQKTPATPFIDEIKGILGARGSLVDIFSLIQ